MMVASSKEYAEQLENGRRLKKHIPKELHCDLCDSATKHQKLLEQNTSELIASMSGHANVTFVTIN
jgi:hypothetical protein